jgi:hypothetical protein
MWRLMETRTEGEMAGLSSSPLSDGEVNFLLWFIQGSIMIPETRRRLRRSWGFCSRHAWGYLGIETAFRPHHLLGPATLYEDLMGHAVTAFSASGPLVRDRLRRRLSSAGPCMLCELNVRKAGRGAAPPARIKRGRSVAALKNFAQETRNVWEPMVCGECRGTRAVLRCRIHLLEVLRGAEAIDLPAHSRAVANIHDHVSAFGRSCVWEHRGTDRPEDRAAVFSAVGWLSGWRPLLALVN